ncbi:hypothetical protein [Egicoccus sp. AB-alg2]|uniref:hypothetical protein n=1 Tax=Egicoccus sp. AB-alg2 TaxID=3242693 RepID=UPI00359E2964
MEPTLVLSEAAARTAGIVLLSVVTIEAGGAYLLRVVRGAVPVTPFQTAFARAGHAHAGVLVTLGLVCLLLAEASGLTGLVGWLARTGVLVAAILMSGGFFFSSAHKGATAPNRWIALVWAGATFLAAGVVSLGVGLLTV